MDGFFQKIYEADWVTITIIFLGMLWLHKNQMRKFKRIERLEAKMDRILDKFDKWFSPN